MGSLSLAILAGLKKFGVMKEANTIKGNLLGASFAQGHRLRENNFPEPSKTIQVNTVIVGGGIAGLSAAWKLSKSGFHDFVLLELEKEVGGNSSYGENAVSAYPWGAHYVPLLTEESTSARQLFHELGIITGYQDGQPIYNDYYLCADPHERLFMLGRWQEGLVPQIGINERDREQYKEFFSTMEHLKDLKGSDGKKLFAIPVDKSSEDFEWRRLDSISMAEYLRTQGWDSPYLNWYVNYCCRDDYGATSEDVSAWAGIHYFAARSGKAANADVQTVITWPEGNGWIVKQIKKQLQPYLVPQSLVFNVSRLPEGVEVRYLNFLDNTTVSINAKNVVFSSPRFVTERLMSSGIDINEFHYSPWMVANITLNRVPQGRGAPLSWDNMVYGSELLGYVNATHQNLNRIQRETVLTYYWPLSHLSPKDAREQAIKRSYSEWRDIVLKELLHIHPELENQVSQIDVWLWGHGMIRPSPGFIWGKTRQRALEQKPPFFYAHSDMSGVSIFEEANHQGVVAAESLMTHENHSFISSL